MANVTIYTDASYCPQTGAGGWAAWIRSSDGSALHGGEFRRPLADNNLAEMAAAANGIAVAIRSGRARRGDLLIIVTDSEAVVRNLPSGFPSAPRWAAMTGEVQRIAEAAGVRFKVNKVKGHSRCDGARSHVNRLVDKEARKHMLAARQSSLALLGTELPSAEPGRVLEVHGAPTNPLELAVVLWRDGVVTRSDMRRAIEAVAAVERRRPDAWARSCARIGLDIPGSWEADPERAEECCAEFTTADVSRVLMERRDGPSGFLTAVKALVFPDEADDCEAASLPLAQALSRQGISEVLLVDTPGRSFLVMPAGVELRTDTPAPSRSP